MQLLVCVIHKKEAESTTLPPLFLALTAYYLPLTASYLPLNSEYNLRSAFGMNQIGTGNNNLFHSCI